MKELSIVGRDCHSNEHVVCSYNVGDRMKVWDETGAFWSGLWGFLIGSAFFWIPGLRPFLDDTTPAKEIINRTQPEILEHHQ